MAEKIREKGYRATPQRITIYEAMWKAGSHPTVSDIHEYATKHDPSISLATVYKTLQLFLEMQLVREMGFRDESTRYDPEMGFHINLICVNCGKVEDIPCLGLDRIAPGLEKKTDFRIVSHRFEIQGICSDCRVPAT